jgi:tetratricopeptide (TPR) repeat protein
VADALEQLYASDLDPHVAELAHHALAAGEPLAKRALGYAIRAGGRAATQFAYDEAAGFYERALELKLRSDPSDGLGRCELSLRMADMLMKGGRTELSRQMLTETSELARSLGAPEQLARAALTLAAPYAEAGFGDELRATLLEAALRALPAPPSPLRVRVLARLAPELYWAHGFERADSVSAEALAMARQLQDDETLGEALDCRYYAILGPDTLEERLELSAELVRLADGTGDRRLQLRGRLWRTQDLIELGAVPEVDTEIDQHVQLARALRQPGHLWVAGYLRAMRALIEGRLEDARRLATEAFAVGQRAQIADAAAVYTAQLYLICRQRGGAEALEQPTVAFTDLYHELIPGYRATQAGVYWMLGRLDDARREYERLATSDFELPRDHNWLAFQWILVDLCAAFDDAQGAQALYDLLRPYAGRCVTVAFAASFAGSVELPLGRLASLLGRYDEADRHFEAPLEAHSGLGAHAATLLARGAPDDVERAHELLASARVTAAELGWTRVERRCEDLGAPVSDEPPKAPAAPVEGVFRREGEYWTISYRSEPFRLRDTKGLRLIATLLARPGAECSVMELLALPLDPDRAGDAGELLDPEAKAAYRKRLADLEEELEQARAFNDVERQTQAQTEIDFLTAELARAVGLGGRDHKAGSAVERARVNATNSIRRVIDRIEREDPALAHHLRSTVSTGRICAYDPGPDPPVTWRL